MAIITMLVGLGVLLVFTVLGCVLEVFLARRESIWPGLALPILAGLYAVVMALSYTAAPDTPWNQVLGGVLAVFLVSGIPAFLLLMVFFAITPAVFVLVWLIRTIKRLITEAKDKTVTAIEEKIEQKKEEHYVRTGI